jgi:hypothetical protein
MPNFSGTRLGRKAGTCADDDDDDDDNINDSYITAVHDQALPIPVAARSTGVDLRPLVCWEWGFEFRRGFGCLPVVGVVCCQVVVSAMI